MDKLKNKLWDLVEEIERKPELKPAEIEYVHLLTDTIKNIDKICMLEEGGYSQAGPYDGGSSYANRGQHWVRGHYSRDGQGGNHSMRGDPYGNPRSGGYSRADGRSEMIEHLQMALDSANEKDRDAIMRLLRQMETA